MDKSAIRNFAIEARKMLMKSAETEAGFYGVTKDGCKSPIQRGNDFEVYETIAGTENRIYGADIKRRANLVKAVETLGFEQVIEETAYTWFNRIIAIRFMEVNDYLPTRVRVLSSETGSSTPDIVTQSLDVDLNMTPEELEKVQKAKDENRYDDAFRMLFIKQCNELNSILPGLFEKTDDYMELLLKLSYTSDGVVRMLIDTIDENNFNVETEGQVEIIGWLYQFYNTEEFNAIYDGNLSKEQVNKYLIPAATQLFTPDWVVRYMIENTLGRMWIEGHEENEFLSNWKYYVSDCEQNEEVRKKLEEIKKVYAEKGPEDIKVFDPCMGSGHILVYAFDVLMQLYEVSGYSQRDAVEHILQKNIYGIDIDERAYQLSYFAIMMKARQYDRRIFSKKIQCNICTIVESNGISVSSLNYFGDGLSDDDRKRAISDLSSLIKLFTDAKEYGSVLNIEKYDWNFLRKFLSTEMYGQITLDAGNLIEVKSRLEKIISVAEIMSQKYEVVCTNPPYLGSSKFSSKLSNYIEKNYKDEKPDLGMVMLNKMLFSYADVNAYIGAITTVSWMFIKSFEKFRSKVLKSKDFVCLVDFGTELFEGKIGHLPVASWINRNSLINQKMTAIRLVDFCYSRRDEKKPEFYNKDNYFSISQSDFFKIQGAPIAYWVSDSVLTAFSERNVGSISEPRMGLTTGRNDKYLRLWYEVEFDNIGFGFNRERAQESRLRWFPYDKGGDYRKWYGNRNYVVDWYDDGHEMQTTMHPNGNRIWAVFCKTFL